MATNYRTFNYTRNDYIIFRTIETYTRTASGKCWKSKPDEIENEIVTAEYYTNYVTAIPFFNNFGHGAYCRAAFTYNETGYLPTTITTVSPFRECKKIAFFWFISRDKLTKTAGWRENEILNNAKRFSVEYVDGSKMIHFYTDSDGDTSHGIFDTKRNIWRG